MLLLLKLYDNYLSSYGYFYFLYYILSWEIWNVMTLKWSKKSNGSSRMFQFFILKWLSYVYLNSLTIFDKKLNKVFLQFDNLWWIRTHFFSCKTPNFSTKNFLILEHFWDSFRSRDIQKKIFCWKTIFHIKIFTKCQKDQTFFQNILKL